MSRLQLDLRVHAQSQLSALASGLLFWSAACFWLLSANNLLLVLDLIVLPNMDLAVPRALLSVAAVATLLFGFVWNGDGE